MPWRACHLRRGRGGEGRPRDTVSCCWLPMPGGRRPRALPPAAPPGSPLAAAPAVVGAADAHGEDEGHGKGGEAEGQVCGVVLVNLGQARVAALAQLLPQHCERGHGHHAQQGPLDVPAAGAARSGGGRGEAPSGCRGLPAVQVGAVPLLQHRAEQLHKQGLGQRGSRCRSAPVPGSPHDVAGRAQVADQACQVGWG